MRFLIFFGLSLSLLACGDEPAKKSTPANSVSNNTSSNNASSNNASNNVSTNNINPELCGNGILDAGEACDSGIPTGPGSCPNACANETSCAVSRVVGTAAQCTARCVAEPVTACQDDDGCCPVGCDINSDSDCSASCGDGIVDINETCDGNCPSQCSDNNNCTVDTLVGSPTACTARCQFNPITTCQSGDGCCPTGCTFAQDNDCSCQPLTCQTGQCGSVSNGCGGFLNCGGCSNGRVCSNNQCITQPTQLPAGSACTSANQCAGIINPYCSPNVNYFQGYCSSECQFDNDCYSGSHCAQKDANGLGTCLDNCNTNTDCRTNYACLPSGAPNNAEACLPSGVGTVPIGGACSALYQCNNGADAICETSFPGGYCTQLCNATEDVFGFTSCPAGSACNPNGSSTLTGFCAPRCNPGTCRTGYSCQAVTYVIGGSNNLCLPN